MPDLRGDRRDRPVSLFLLCSFVVIFLFTRMTPLLADDFIYAFSYADGFRIDNVFGILFSLIPHRRYINGRVISHFFVMLFVMLPKWIFDLMNALVFTLEMLLVYRFLCVEERSHATPLLVLGAAQLWISMPVFGQVFLWLDGACNYSWGLALALLFVLPFYRCSIKGSLGWPLWQELLFLPLAFMGGAYSEHISLSMLAAALLLLIASRIRHGRAPLFLILALLAGAGGYLTLLLTPPVQEAVQQLFASGDLSSLLVRGSFLLLCAAAALLLLFLWIRHLRRRGRLSAFCRCLLIGLLCAYAGCLAVLALRAFRSAGAFLPAVQDLLSSSALGLITALSSFTVLFLAAVLRRADRARLISSALLFLGGISSLVLSFFAGYFPARACAAPVMFSILAGLPLIPPAFHGRQKLSRTAAATVAAVFLLCFLLGSADILQLHGAAEAREQTIRETLARGEDTVYLTPYTCRTKYAAKYGLEDLDPPEQSWPRDTIGMYYDIPHLVVISP